MKKLLFQGDSITDAARSRQNDYNLGYGFVTQIMANLGSERVGQYRFVNRGIGGNRIADILQRTNEDVIALKPDVVTLLCGINDVWYYLDKPNGFDEAAYEMDICAMLEQIRSALPDVGIIILEPFVEEGSNTSNVENPEKYKNFRKGTEQCATLTERVAQKYGCRYVKLQHLFDQAVKNDGSAFFLDGIHPSIIGHKIIADAWISEFKQTQWFDFSK